MRFLVIDDSPTSRAKIVHILEQAFDVEIVEAEEGEEAWNIFKENQDFNLILCDWVMPKMNGFEFLKKIRMLGNEVPFMMVTSYAGNSDVMAALQSGADNYLPKPFTGEQLVNKVKKLIE